MRNKIIVSLVLMALNGQLFSQSSRVIELASTSLAVTISGEDSDANMHTFASSETLNTVKLRAGHREEEGAI